MRQHSSSDAEVFLFFLVYSPMDTTVAFVRNRFNQAVLIDTEDQLIAAHLRIIGENMLSKGNMLNDC